MLYWFKLKACSGVQTLLIRNDRHIIKEKWIVKMNDLLPRWLLYQIFQMGMCCMSGTSTIFRMMTYISDLCQWKIRKIFLRYMQRIILEEQLIESIIIRKADSIVFFSSVNMLSILKMVKKFPQEKMKWWDLQSTSKKR